MKLTFDSNNFSKSLRQKRLIEMNTDLRTLAKSLKVSAATLSRCEKGRTPELLTFATLCEWLNIPMNEFIKKGKNK